MLHKGHLGIEKTRRLARQTVYWAGMNHDIAELINDCATCLTYHNRQQKEPLLTEMRVEHPWEKIGTDLFHFKGREYLLMIDYYSNYPEMALLTSITATGVVKHMKSSFARHGIPETVVSDNGPRMPARSSSSLPASMDLNMSQ